MKGDRAADRDPPGSADAEDVLRRERDRSQLYLDLAGVLFVALAPDGRVTLANAKTCEVLGYREDEILGRNWFETFVPASIRHEVRAAFDQLMRGEIEAVEHFENPVLTRWGEERLIAWHSSFLRDPDARIVGTLSSGMDVTRQKRTADKLRHRLDFESLVAEISTRFISLPGPEIDGAIEEALASIGRFCGVDHAVVFLLAGDGQTVHRGFDWYRDPGLVADPPARVLRTAAFPWAAEALLNGMSFVVSRLDSLPEEAAASRALLESQGLRSVLRVPMKVKGELRGFVGFSTIRAEREWSEDDLTMVRMVGQIIFNALEHRRSDEELRRALEQVARLNEQVEAENVYLREEVKKTDGFEGLVGQSDAFLGVLEQVEQVGPTDAGVLVLGETGTGKDVVARALHRLSPRADRAFVKVDCTSLPATLVENELFGHEKGAFTGALAKTTGRFELADGGTVFLDEIGDLPVDVQAKLLRILQDGEFERLGSPETHKVDVRIIAATHRRLDEAVEQGTFRSDLYYRLSVFPILIPPLRDRRTDIPLFVRHFIAQSEEKLRKKIDSVPPGVMNALVAYDWPGNLRELRNVIERAMILSDGSVLSIEDPAIWNPPRTVTATGSVRLDEVEREHILRVVGQCGWRIGGRGNAAERLGLHPSTLRSRMKKLGIARPPSAARANPHGGRTD